MAKAKTAYVCTDCGAEFTKWQGQCTECKAWNTLTEFRISPNKKNTAATQQANVGYAGVESQLQDLDKIDLSELPRITTGIAELDRVLGGGLVPGSAILIGGNPGAGKSTILLQVMCHLAQQMPAMYVTGEESLQQVAMRANRLGLPTANLKMLTETDVTQITQAAQQVQPKIMVVDSIQVMQHPDMDSAPGGVSQVKESAAYLTRFAKQTNTILLIVGHVTKEGALAGPKVLEHMIDTFIMLDSGSDNRYRTLRGHKNRFGAVNELGVFAMTETGMKEVKNPSAIFLSRGEEATPGSIVTVIWEGTRPLLVELQALVDECSTDNPRRVALGSDYNRLAMLIAVLHKHGGVFVGSEDIFTNIVGGVKVTETSTDLAMLVAIISSFKNRVLPQDMIVFGEVGLAGEIRPVPSGQERILEAAKHGFKRAIIPAANVSKGSKTLGGMELIPVSKLSQVLSYLS